MGTVWETRFNNHALWALVAQMGDQLDAARVPEDVDLLDSFSRLVWLIETINAHRLEDARRYSNWHAR
jgi:hypothetical protein